MSGLVDTGILIELSAQTGNPASLPHMLGWLIRRIWAARVSRTDGITAMQQVARTSAAGTAAGALAIPCFCLGCSHA
jgi:hypothetical protein